MSRATLIRHLGRAAAAPFHAAQLLTGAKSFMDNPLRVEIWAYGRRNPFLPWAGLDPFRAPALGSRRAPLFWRTGDAAEALGLKRNGWRRREDVSAFDPAFHEGA